MDAAWVGFFAFALVGVSLGLVGSGGSVLTVPILAYLFGIPASVAATYSLFIVGTTALVGAVRMMGRGQVEMPLVAAFGAPSAAGMFLGRNVLVPALPETLLSFGSYTLSRDRALLVLFAILMLLAGRAMIRPLGSDQEVPSRRRRALGHLAIEGIAVGTLMGLVGAGGGFLIVPILMHRMHLDMNKAVGTSLATIALSSILGYAGGAFRQTIQWPLLMVLSGISFAGLFVGTSIAAHVPSERLRPALGVFILFVGSLVLGKELWR